jgi:phage baseplate assembly protein W
MQIRYPFDVDLTGAVTQATDADHIEQMIEQVLFTRPGERVNRPDFGCGLTQLIFEPANSELAAVTNALVRSALLKWMGDLIHVDALTITAVDDTFTVNLSYAILGTQTRNTATFTQ